MEKKAELYYQIAGLYSELFDAIKEHFTENEGKKISTLVPMQGCRYGSGKTKMMVVGRATNGWGEMAVDYSDQKAKYIEDAMKLIKDKQRFSWIPEAKQKTEKKERYYAEAKPFWNYTRSILEQLSGSISSDWYQSIVWSNLFPVSFAKEGNPSEKLKEKQFKIAKELLHAQIEYFEPTHVLFITNWDGWFVVNNESFLPKLEKKGDNKVIKGRGKFDSSLVVITRRPEYFPKKEFVEEAVEAFRHLEDENNSSLHP